MTNFSSAVRSRLFSKGISSRRAFSLIFRGSEVGERGSSSELEGDFGASSGEAVVGCSKEGSEAVSSMAGLGAVCSMVNLGAICSGSDSDEIGVLISGLGAVLIGEGLLGSLGG